MWLARMELSNAMLLQYAMSPLCFPVVERMVRAYKDVTNVGTMEQTNLEMSHEEKLELPAASTRSLDKIHAIMATLLTCFCLPVRVGGRGHRSESLHATGIDFILSGVVRALPSAHQSSRTLPPPQNDPGAQFTSLAHCDSLSTRGREPNWLRGQQCPCDTHILKWYR